MDLKSGIGLNIIVWRKRSKIWSPPLYLQHVHIQECLENVEFSKERNQILELSFGSSKFSANSRFITFFLLNSYVSIENLIISLFLETALHSTRKENVNRAFLSLCHSIIRPRRALFTKVAEFVHSFFKQHFWPQTYATFALNMFGILKKEQKRIKSRKMTPLH